MVCLLVLSLMILANCRCGLISNASSSISKDIEKRNFTFGMYEHKTSLLETEENGTSAVKTRVKRQLSSGAGKFTEAAQVPQLKVLRLFLQMFKNLWAPVYVGGSNPFHPYVPKPIVQLFKYRIVDFFFPDIGEEARKV